MIGVNGTVGIGKICGVVPGIDGKNTAKAEIIIAGADFSTAGNLSYILHFIFVDIIHHHVSLGPGEAIQ